MGNDKSINWNKIATVLSVVVALSSIGVFSFFKDSINKVNHVLESVDRIEHLEVNLTAQKKYYDSVIGNYKKIHYNDSIKLEDVIKKQKEDSTYIYWSYDWVVYLKKFHND